MANGRLWLRCRNCGRMRLLAKWFGVDWVTDSWPENRRDLAGWLTGHGNCIGLGPDFFDTVDDHPEMTFDEKEDAWFSHALDRP